MYPVCASCWWQPGYQYDCKVWSHNNKWVFMCICSPFARGIFFSSMNYHPADWTESAFSVGRNLSIETLSPTLGRNSLFVTPPKNNRNSNERVIKFWICQADYTSEFVGVALCMRLCHFVNTGSTFNYHSLGKQWLHRCYSAGKTLLIEWARQDSEPETCIVMLTGSPSSDFQVTSIY